MLVHTRRRCVVFVVSVLAAGGAARGSLGSLPITQEQYDGYPRWEASALGTGSLPRVDLRAYLPAVGLQNPQKSCVGWAVAYACKTCMEARDQGWRPDRASRVFSPAFLYNQINLGRAARKDAGAYIVHALDKLVKQGCATWATMPYNPRDFLSQPSRAALAEAAKFRCRRYWKLTTGAGIRQALQEGHVVIISIPMDPEFNSGRWDIFTPAQWAKGIASLGADATDRRKIRGHALCIVGYDDTRRAFLLMNSWSRRWGKRGYAWLHYDLAKKVGPSGGNYLRQAWVVQDIREKITPDAPPRPPATDKDVKIRGSYRYGGYTPKGHVWAWRTLIYGSARALGGVRKVVWQARTAGSSWRPVETTDALSYFQYVGYVAGSGAIDIAARVYFRDNSTRTLTYRFHLAAPKKRDLALVQTDRYWGKKRFRTAAGQMKEESNWEWTLQLRGSLVDLGDVRQVTYHLHPTFPDPNRVVTESYRNGFAFTTRGWGTFTVKATVLFRDGSKLALTTPLKFRDPVRDVLTLRNTARLANRREGRNELYNWTAYVDGPLKLLREIKAVRYHLHPTFRPSVVDVGDGLDYGFPLSRCGWGTFTLKATVSFRDGSTQQLSHALKFHDAPSGGKGD